MKQIGSDPTKYHLDDESLTDIVRRVEDAWFSSNANGWPIKVFATHMIIDGSDGLEQVDYTVDDDGGIVFGTHVKVDQVFVAARDPNNRSPMTFALDVVRRAFHFRHDGLRAEAISSSQAGEGSRGSVVTGSPDPKTGAPKTVANQDNAILLQVPLRIYADGDQDDERYVGGVVLEPGDDNAYGDTWDPNDIRLMAHKFMETSQHMDYMHTSKIVAKPIESVYFPLESEGGQESYKFYGEDIKAGSWWLGSRVTNEETWAQVKSGELTGYSMFAIRTADMDIAQNKAYADIPEAPPGRKMLASEWEITMVALVDAPAVRKAVFVKMMRDPTKPPSEGITYQDSQGSALSDPAQSAVTQIVEAILYGQGENPMKKIPMTLAYLEGEANKDGDPEGEGAGTATAVADPPAETDPPETDPTATAGDGDGDGATGDGEGDGEGDDVLTKSFLSKTMTDFLGKVEGTVETQVTTAVAAALEPITGRLDKLEGRSNRASGSGALPSSTSSSNDDDDEGDGEKPKFTEDNPDWARYSGNPKPRSERQHTS